MQMCTIRILSQNVQGVPAVKQCMMSCALQVGVETGEAERSNQVSLQKTFVAVDDFNSIITLVVKDLPPLVTIPL